MSFLPNDGDIIIDAVLTDEGRKRLSKGDGSFKIAKFALGDDEIDYSLVDLTLPTATRYLDVYSTPVLEAFTNNSTGLRNKLLSIPRNDLLYLPVIKLNTIKTPMCDLLDYGLTSPGTFIIAVDQDTENEFAVTSSGSLVPGVLMGAAGGGLNYVQLDQGLDTSQISPVLALDASLIETQYAVYLDNRFGSLLSSSDSVSANVSYVDSDDIASYFFTINDSKFVKINTNNTTTSSEIIAGPRGTVLSFKVKSSIDLATSDYLFSNLGGTETMTGKTGVPYSVFYIDSYVRVVGLTTGYTVDIPVRYIKFATV